MVWLVSRKYWIYYYKDYSRKTKWNMNRKRNAWLILVPPTEATRTLESACAVVWAVSKAFAILLFDLANHQRVSSPCLYYCIIQVEIAKALLPDAFRSYLLLVAFLLLACCSNEKLMVKRGKKYLRWFSVYDGYGSYIWFSDSYATWIFHFNGLWTLLIVAVLL